ncbi:hypothetical protein UFOVP1528_49 [uncultured Caudovirales phage]|uniref:Uncharacterized protein n=1 Tax=uncultured Caudovirales phage TaxID=2100421 RepID=A0A6J5SEE5_9CAUD|nr:hypothetical protein UFOVP905_27 [uncultured Caudovirales phage]CAB4182634.1 hypothetical protein UFOVP1080_14 [uncultured Caudovirales phage]CAB4197204.1 hypothetical protein UFOVP1321_2 [uncultured Caudovirales phage]CAB4212393.1 hypothetical protein UFOVP1432_12 [uncultured Caudovirales phage]CAB5227528.1 hypothetical protein UFOVP1528_49 [uncultured Caudovirales phage]
MSSERIPAYKDADVTCFLEKTDGVLFIHVDVKHWSVGVYKKFKRILKEILDNLDAEGYKYLFAYNVHQDEKWAMFVSMFGFTKAFVKGGLDVYYIGCK